MSWYLYPAQDRPYFAHKTVDNDEIWPYGPLVDMQLKIDSKNELQNHGHKEERSE